MWSLLKKYDNAEENWNLDSFFTTVCNCIVLLCNLASELVLDRWGGWMSCTVGERCLLYKLGPGTSSSSGCLLVCLFFFLSSPLKLWLYFSPSVQWVMLPFYNALAFHELEGKCWSAEFSKLSSVFSPNSTLSCTVSCWNKCESLSLLSLESLCVFVRFFMTEWQSGYHLF